MCFDFLIIKMAEKKRVTFTIAVVATPNENFCQNVVKTTKKESSRKLLNSLLKNTSIKNALMP